LNHAREHHTKMPETIPALSVQEFARRNAISESTVRRMVRTGQLEAFRVGVQLRIRPDVAEAVQHPYGELAKRVDALVADWPKLTDDQLDRIAALLRGASRSAPKTKRPSPSRQRRARK
jgi:excisionase family DNA binding protein